MNNYGSMRRTMTVTTVLTVNDTIFLPIFRDHNINSHMTDLKEAGLEVHKAPWGARRFLLPGTPQPVPSDKR